MKRACALPAVQNAGPEEVLENLGGGVARSSVMGIVSPPFMFEIGLTDLPIFPRAPPPTVPTTLICAFFSKRCETSEAARSKNTFELQNCN